jgi:hypothetical protein
VAALIAPGRSDGDGSTSTAREAPAAALVTTAKLRIAEEAKAVKAAEEATIVKVAKEAMVIVLKDEATTKVAAQRVAGAKVTMELVGSTAGSSSALSAGTKRVATLGGSTPPSKRFHCAWKP